MVTRLVSAGMGIAVVPYRYGDRSYHVKRLAITGTDFKRVLYMFWKGEQSTPAEARFFEFVRGMVSVEEVRHLTD